MAKIRGAVVIDRERCKGCNLCVVACPLDVLALSTKEVNRKGYNFAYEARDGVCTGCTSCALVCPDGCISVYRIKEE
ncbi:MAG: 4Fe-4S binding protein [Bacteroidia bacterium]|nr:4Fe-4S binding protein [Bacteroidia bacterium]